MLATVATLQKWGKNKLLRTAPSVDPGELVSAGSLGNTLVGAGSRVTTAHILANPSNLIIVRSVYTRGVHQTMVVQCLTCTLRSQTCQDLVQEKGSSLAPSTVHHLCHSPCLPRNRHLKSPKSSKNGPFHLVCARGQSPNPSFSNNKCPC
jgi:hypothetical protein